MTCTRMSATLALATMGLVRAIFAQGAMAGSAATALTRFTVTVEDLSTASTLKLSKGGAMSVPLSAVAWAVHTGGNPMFTPGQIEPGIGLKGLAEAGMAREFAANLGRVPGVRSHGACDDAPAAPMKGGGMKAPASMCRMLTAGDRSQFTIEARPGDKLSLAAMLGPSNDGLVASGAAGIALFDAGGRPLAGNVTAQMSLWDAGTEVNEEPGLGPNQGVNQQAPNAGDPERRPVRAMADVEFGRLWPPAGRIVRVTLSPAKI